MKKLFIPALILLASLNAHARYHDEIARVQVNTGCTLLGTLVNPNMSCLRTALGNSTVTFAESFLEVPNCFMGNETSGAVISFTPSITGVAVTASSLLTAVGVNSTYSFHCFGI